MTYVTIKIYDITQGTVLSGAGEGKRAFLAMIEQTKKEPNTPSPLLVDFTGIDVATASYLREAVFAFKGYMRTSGSKFYPVVANINDAIREELIIVAEAKSDALLAVQTNESGHVTKQSVVGSLDPKQASTFERVSELGTTDAGSLMAKYGAAEDTTTTTAWNNRLSALVSRGLVREFSQGRAKFYRPLFEEAR